MNEQPPPTFYTLWFRESANRPWVPLRRTRTYTHAVMWVGVERSHGCWLILPGRTYPTAGAGISSSHRFEIPKDVSHLKSDSPPPTPEECRRWRVERVANWRTKNTPAVAQQMDCTAEPSWVGGAF